MDMHVLRNVRVAFRWVHVFSARLSVCTAQTNMPTVVQSQHLRRNPAALLPSSTRVVFTGTNLLPLHVQVCSWGVNPPSVGVILQPGHLPARVMESTHIFHKFAKTPFALHNKRTPHIHLLRAACSLIRPNQPENTWCQLILVIWRASNPGLIKK